MAKYVQRKGSKIIWEVWNETESFVSIMNYSNLKPSSRIVTRKNFNKYWIETKSK